MKTFLIIEYIKDIRIIVRYEEILLHMGNSNIFVW